MRLLLDTHAILWLLAGHEDRFGGRARRQIADSANTVFASVVSFWEIAVKVRIGKLDASVPEVIAGASNSGITTLGLDAGHLLCLAALPVEPRHRDPFDHLLVAQALSEGLTFVSEDEFADRYGVPILRCSA